MTYTRLAKCFALVALGMLLTCLLSLLLPVIEASTSEYWDTKFITCGFLTNDEACRDRINGWEIKAVMPGGTLVLQKRR